MHLLKKKKRIHTFRTHILRLNMTLSYLELQLTAVSFSFYLLFHFIVYQISENWRKILTFAQLQAVSFW